ncbi:HlyC/CorC family transporter [Clostridium sp.]|uniref:HlyC/CorC family transporter n=1 Tax=Clostridium sp. TaxID=1506 RepID=UPI0025BF8329|nr:hemolysin family protein [Clostridium sp.]MCI9304471.1 HlyC/CorC family transporter [Clostridium sp.]
MDDNVPILIVVIAILIIMSAYFSATETAFSSLNKIKLKNLAVNGSKRAENTLKLTKKFDSILSTILIGNNIVNIASASIATIVFTEFFGNAGVTLSTIVMTIVVLIFGEISPKSLAKESPEKFAMFSTPILKGLLILFTPLNFLFGLWKRIISKVIKVEEISIEVEEELLTIVEEAEIKGGIDEHESKLIRSAIEFNDLDADQILTARVDLISIPKEATIEEVRKVFKENKFSRIPVYESNIDNIIGVIHEKDFYDILDENKDTIDSIIKPIVYVTSNTKISELLKKFQYLKNHMAVVIDEFGGTMGIITLEDVLEELVGEIWDEHDEIVEYFKRLDENRYSIICSVSLADFFEEFSMKEEIDDFEVQTVNGWIVNEFGYLPKIGESFLYKNLNIYISKIEGRRVKEIIVEKLIKE